MDEKKWINKGIARLFDREVVIDDMDLPAMAYGDHAMHARLFPHHVTRVRCPGKPITAKPMDLLVAYNAGREHLQRYEAALETLRGIIDSVLYEED